MPSSRQVVNRLLAVAVVPVMLIGAGLGAHWSHRPDKPPIVIYEDGSGVQYQGDIEVKTFPEGTFVWDCHRMGNRVCG
jgi:hypothetical protein